MSIDDTLRRRGMGPMVDPGFEARVERIAAMPEEAAGKEALASGYIEFTGPDAHDCLLALIKQIYQQAASATLVRKIHYLTTDPECGIALPMASFMPALGNASKVQHGTSLEFALQQLARATAGRLSHATRIGLTVEFDLEVIARAMRPMFSPDPEVRKLAEGRAWTADDMQAALFGGDARMRSLGVRKMGLAGPFSPQLADAQCLLQTPAAAAPMDFGFSPQTGRNTIVGIVDFGCDFAHPSFRCGARSRILAIWDQNGSPTTPESLPVVFVNGVPCEFGFGRLFDHAAIESALGQWLGSAPNDPARPYALLGYDPHVNHYTQAAPGSADGPPGAHGTFVMEVAAGGRRSVPADAAPTAQPRGVAPDAHIVFVQVRLHPQPDGRRELDLNDVIQAVAFIFNVADNQGLPCVVNLSLNTMSGAHDGDSYFDLHLANLLRSGKGGQSACGRAVVIAAGNLPDSSVQALRWQHVSDKIDHGTPLGFDWRMAPLDLTRNIIEIWYDATDAWLQVTLEAPDRNVSCGPVPPGATLPVEINGQWRGSIMGSSPVAAGMPQQGLVTPAMVPGRHVIRLELADPAPNPVIWKVRLAVVTADGNPPASGQPVRFHCWLERDDNGPSGLSRTGQPPMPVDAKDLPCTIGTLSCGPDAIVVGGYSTALGCLGRWDLSGHGPSRRGDILKPDLAAPAHYLTLVRSCRGNGLPESLAHITGTSVAAPFVTGTIACLYEQRADATLAQVRQALVQSARPLPGQPAGWTADLGHGRLDPAGAVAFLA